MTTDTKLAPTEFAVTINGFAPELRSKITTALQQNYGFGKFFTFPDGIYSEALIDITAKEQLRKKANELADAIWAETDYVYCSVVVQVTPPPDLAGFDEFRY